MGDWPREIVAYETSNGEFHRSRSSAEFCQLQIDRAAEATRLLEAGKSLGVALRESGCVPSGYPELDEVFASTKLVIEYWQGRSEAGYSPTGVLPGGMVEVWGNAGCWSGPYGAPCTPADVVRYWLDTKRRAEAATKRGRP